MVVGEEFPEAGVSMINMRNEFRAVLEKWGYNIYLQRRIDTLDTPEIEFENKLEKHTVRSAYMRKNALEFSADEQSEGITNNLDLLFYFMHDANPGRGDRIYEEDCGKPSSSKIYTIDDVLPLRGHAGEVIYWTAGVTEEDF